MEYTGTVGSDLGSNGDAISWNGGACCVIVFGVGLEGLLG